MPPPIARAQLMMERQLQQMVRLVDDLLDVSRITTGKLVLRTERVSLQEVMMTAIDAVRPLIDAKRQTLSVDLPAVTVELDADATRLSQILANILNNAVKYTEPGGSIRDNRSARSRCGRNPCFRYRNRHRRRGTAGGV